MDIVIYKRKQEWVVDSKHAFSPWAGEYIEDDRIVLHVESYEPLQPPTVTTSSSTRM